MNQVRIATLDETCQLLGIGNPLHAMTRDGVGFGGAICYQLHGEDGEVKGAGVSPNLITKTGDNYYMERAAGIGSPPAQVTGMKLGKDATVPNKGTNTGLSIGTYITGKNCSQGLDGGFPTATLDVPGCQITWRSTWGAGVATSAGDIWAEVVVTIEAGPADDAGTTANTIARALLSPTVNKGVTDVLTVTWNHIGLGA